MNKITPQIIDNFLSSDITFSRLEGFIREYSVYEDYKKEFGEGYKSIVEDLWGSINKKFRDHQEPGCLKENDFLAVMEFDLGVLPYLGVSFDKRKEFYFWCFDYIKKII